MNRHFKSFLYLFLCCYIVLYACACTCLLRLAILNRSLGVLIFGTFHWGLPWMDWAPYKVKQCHQNKYSACVCVVFILSGKTF